MAGSVAQVVEEVAHGRPSHRLRLVLLKLGEEHEVGDLNLLPHLSLPQRLQSKFLWIQM